MSPALAAPLFAVSLVATLAAARSFARRLDRHATALRLPEAMVGVLTALAADGPEISSALVALAKGAPGVSVGVVVGSNVFNLAAMIGLSALLAGRVRLPRETLWLEGTVAAWAFLGAVAVLLGWVPPAVGAVLVLAVLVPYVLVLVRGPAFLGRFRPVRRFAGLLKRALSERERRGRPPAGLERFPWHQGFLFLVDVALIVLGSVGMVQAAISLGNRWHVRGAVIGVLILAPLTSVPNAATAVRLGLAGRGSALVSETFNSNTINFVAGVILPALFAGVPGLTATARLDLVWLAGMTLACMLFLARREGMGRLPAVLIACLYGAFVASQFAFR